MPTWMLDTSVCVAALRNQASGIRERLVSGTNGIIAISAIVAAELRLGVAKAGRRRQDEIALRKFLGSVPSLDWPSAAASMYAALRSQLESTGQVIGALDMLIAAHALHEKATLVTDNVREFSRVRGLRVENWMRR